jgi:hypothetical protein
VCWFVSRVCQLARVPELGACTPLVFPYNPNAHLLHLQLDRTFCFLFRQRHASFSVWKILLFIIVISCGELSCWVPQVQTSFSNVSRDQGFLALNEVYQALQQAGFTLDEPSFYTACQSFDPNRLGKFKLDDYISMCIFLQSAKNLFGAFDTSRIGHITLDFNQFVYCAANLRV